jgi:hypothetical protein
MWEDPECNGESSDNLKGGSGLVGPYLLEANDNDDSN